MKNITVWATMFVIFTTIRLVPLADSNREDKISVFLNYNITLDRSVGSLFSLQQKEKYKRDKWTATRLEKDRIFGEAMSREQGSTAEIQFSEFLTFVKKGDGSFISCSVDSPNAAGIDIIYSSLYERKSYSGNLIVCGEVKNNGSSVAVFPKLHINMYNELGTLFDIDYTYIDGGSIANLGSDIYTNVLKPGETGFFILYTSVDSDEVDKFTLSTSSSSYTIDSYAQANLTFSEGPTSGSLGGDVTYVGAIKNNSSRYVAYFVKPYFAVYNAFGQVIDVDYTYVNGTTYDGCSAAIEPKASATFKCYTDAPVVDAVSYKTAIEWDEAEIAGGSTYSIVVNSLGASGVPITVSPDDENGDSDGTTNFSREYDNSSTVTLTAPQTHYGKNFSKWVLDGTTYMTRQVSFIVYGANVTATVYYTGSGGQLAVSRNSLTFVVLPNSGFSNSQSFTIYDAVAGSDGSSLNWTIFTTNWIYAPTSGRGSAMVSVRVNPGTLIAGNYSGMITVTDGNASDSPQHVSIILKVVDSDQAPPFGSIDTPREGDTVRSSIPVTGWALDDVELEKVELHASNDNGANFHYIGDASLAEGARPDLEAAFSHFPANYKAGWGYMLLTNYLPGRTDGLYVIKAVAKDSSGKSTELGRKSFTVDNAHVTKPFGALDTPGQGGVMSGSSFANWGWTLTPQPHTIKTDGSTITVIVDGVAVGHPDYNRYRADIVKYFPGYNNTSGASGLFMLDTTAYQDGVHTIQWTVKDEGGNTDGIGSRFFTINNNSADNRSGLAGRSSKTNRSTFTPGIPSPTHVFEKEISVRRCDRVVLDIGRGYSEACMLFNSNERLLPPGTTFKDGYFYWGIGPGTAGDFTLIFKGKDKENKTITISIN